MPKQWAFAIVLGVVLDARVLWAISGIFPEGMYGCTAKHDMMICS